MADVTLIGFRRDGDKLTLTGTGFTKTTTTVFVDDASAPFEWLSETEITIDAPQNSAATISVEKGGVTSAELTADAATEQASGATEPAPDATEPEGHTPDTSTTAEGEDELADATKSELAGAANAGAETAPAPASASLKEAPDPKTAPHLEAEGFRQAVENTPAGDLNMDPREPYPTGNPPDPREAFHRMHGYYQED